MPNNPPRGNPITEHILRELYLDEKKSLAEISSSLGISVHKVTYWMWKHKIPTRSISEAVYLKYNPNGDPFSVKTDLGLDETKLKYLALGLYWGEGNKVSNRAVRVTNSDPGVIRQFHRFLLEVCRVKVQKIGYYLQTFKDNDMERAKRYWANCLNVGPEKIHTCKPIHTLGKGTYRKINRFGVMTIAFSNTHLKTWILNELGKLGMVR